MISLQAHNQVLYHLTQLTNAINPRSTPIAIKAKKTKNESCHRNISDPSDKCITEVSDSYMESTTLKSDTPHMDMLKGLKNDLKINLDDLSVTALKVSPKINPKWKVSFVSASSFAENKRGFPCSELTEPIILPAIYLSSKEQNRLLRNIYGKALSSYNIQICGFKTHRKINAELERNRKPFSRFRKLFDRSSWDTEKKSATTEVKGADKLRYLVNSADTLTDEEKRIKAAFLEGYEAGFRKDSQKLFTPKKVLQFLFYAALTFLILYSTAAQGGMASFRLPFESCSEINPEEITVTFDDVKGVEEAKRELQDVVEFLKNPSKIASLGGKLPKGILLVGPPGTGKTLLSRAVAGEAGVPFFYTSGPEFDEILVGQGARRVRDLFKAAKKRAPCVIFIDEIDSVGGTRTKSVVHPFANQTINQLLSEMDGFHQNEGVIVLAATNRYNDLDKALLRPGRFDVEVYVNKPDYRERIDLLKLYLGKIQMRDIDVEFLARSTLGFTGADIENLVNQAALRAALVDAKYVTMEHMEYAKDKVMMGPERKFPPSCAEANRVTAYHEGGHTLVALLTKDGPKLHKVTIAPRGASAGHTSFVPPAEYHPITKSQLLAQMDTRMGGRAAEELIFGPDKVTIGAMEDLKSATKIAEEMVKVYGMSEKAGFRSIPLESESGKIELQESQLIDAEVRRLLQESYERAKAVLESHPQELKRLADALLEYETLNTDQVNAIIADKKIIFDVSSIRKPIDAPKNVM